MMTGKELRNMWLISLADGRKLGEIKDIYLDGEANRLVAVLLGTEGLLKRKPIVLDRTSIQVCGVDVWLVAPASKVVHLDDLPGADSFVLMSDLRGREVQTNRGAKIGTLGEVVLERDGRVLGFTLSRVAAPGPLQEKKALVRAAITSLGDKTLPVIADLARAETLALPD